MAHLGPCCRHSFGRVQSYTPSFAPWQNTTCLSRRSVAEADAHAISQNCIAASFKICGNGNISAFFVSTKNEPNPEGGSTPKGSLSISAKQKAEGNTRCRSHFFAQILFEAKNGSVKLDLRKWKHFRIFCVNKKRERTETNGNERVRTGTNGDER